MRGLDSRLKKLEKLNTTNEPVVYAVEIGENASLKQQEAWDKYLEDGGRQSYERTLFIQLNGFTCED